MQVSAGQVPAGQRPLASVAARFGHAREALSRAWQWLTFGEAQPVIKCPDAGLTLQNEGDPVYVIENCAELLKACSEAKGEDVTFYIVVEKADGKLELRVTNTTLFKAYNKMVRDGESVVGKGAIKASDSTKKINFKTWLHLYPPYVTTWDNGTIAKTDPKFPLESAKHPVAKKAGLYPTIAFVEKIVGTSVDVTDQQ